MSEPTVCCTVCGSIKVEYAVWYSPNTGETGDEFGSWNAGDNTFCADCDMEGRDPNASLVAECSEPAAFKKARAKRERYETKTRAEENAFIAAAPSGLVRARATVVIRPENEAYPRSYLILDGGFEGLCFVCDPDDEKRPEGHEVIVQFCPDDQFAKEVSL